MNLSNMVADILEDYSAKLRAGNCNLTEEEALDLISQIAHIKLSKQEVADRYGISTKTVERKEQDGELPESYNQTINKKIWFLDELIKFENEKLIRQTPNYRRRT